jgi:exonuclease III
MKLRLATWNMAHWSHKKHSAKAWEYFLAETDSDIFLFQESVPNTDIIKTEHLVWNEIGGSRPWGSGIFSPKYKIREYSFDNCFSGAVTAAEVEINNDLTVIVISLYGLMEKISSVSYAIPNLHRIFSDLTRILEFKETKHRVIIGGDLNASQQIDEIQTGNAHRVFFDRLKEFGLVNCFDNYYQDYVQTHRHSRSKKPWQNDYFFISKRSEKYLKNCEVLDNDTVRKLSDHNPVVIELNV